MFFPQIFEYVLKVEKWIAKLNSLLGIRMTGKQKKNEYPDPSFAHHLPGSYHLDSELHTGLLKPADFAEIRRNW
jgi:hypothetical protein